MRYFPKFKNTLKINAQFDQNIGNTNINLLITRPLQIHNYFNFTIMNGTIFVGGSRGQNMANRNFVRQITKFGIIVFWKKILCFGIWKILINI